MKHLELLNHEIDDHGFTHRIAIRSRRGIHVGTCNDNDMRPVLFSHGSYSARAIRAIDRWVIVPRWMTPLQALNTLLP